MSDAKSQNENLDHLDNKVVIGKNGFLFLGGSDSNDLERHLTGTRNISIQALNIWRNNIKSRESMKYKINGVVIPEAHVIYRDLLPKWFIISDDRPINMITNLANCNLDYPIHYLTDQKDSENIIYTGDDSHWTEVAAHRYWLKARLQLGLKNEFVCSYIPDHQNESKDLRIKIENVATEKHEKDLRKWNKTDGSLIFSTKILNRGLSAIFFNENAKNGRLLVFGTSFSVRLMPFYMADFKEVLFIYSTSIDRYIVNTWQPDFIFMEMPERFVHFPAVDVDVSSSLVAAIARADTGANDRSEFTLTHLINMGLDQKTIQLLNKLNSINELIITEQNSNTEIEMEAMKFGLMSRSHPSLLPFFCGMYRSNASLYSAFQCVDEGRIDLGDINFLPQSEMGLLVKARILLRNKRQGELHDTIDQLIVNYGLSTETKYFVKAAGLN